MTAVRAGGMDVWLSLPFLPAEGLRELAQAAEKAGVTGLALSEHPCVPADFASPYPYGGAKPAVLPTETLLPDPLVAIASLAASTSAVRLMTAVLIAPLRHPVMLAKEVATVATMSGGRFDLGVGVGWLREEFEALGNDGFAVRGAVLDEMLPLLDRLWTGQPVEHRGKHFSFPAVAVNPTPPQRIPLYIGGSSKGALRRCALLADGWVGANLSVEEVAGVVLRLGEARSEAGTDERPFAIRTGLRGTVTPARIAALRQAGVDSFMLAPWQIGERRESIRDLPVAAIAEALPNMVDMISSA